MTQLVKCLLNEHEDLSSDSQNVCKKKGVFTQGCNSTDGSDRRIYRAD